MNPSGESIEVIGERERAEVLMNPLRLRILEAAREPGSAAELARRLGLKAQKVNYHVQRLAEHGFLRVVEERRAGNVVETVYASTAESYVLSSDVLGGLSPRAMGADMVTAARWLALQARAEAELGEVVRSEAGTGRPVHAFSMDAEFRFETAEQRALFARAARELFMAVVSKYTSPAWDEAGEPGAGRPYRLLLGCYPIPERAPSPGPAGPRLVRDEAGDEGDGADPVGDEAVDGNP